MGRKHKEIQQLSAAERLALVEQPYLRTAEIGRLVGKPKSTVYDWLKASEIKKYGGFGYLTDDVIKTFRLDGSIKRWRAAA